MTVKKNPRNSARSTSSSPSGSHHSNSRTRLATKYSRWSMAAASPGHTRRPAPNGIILSSLVHVRSAASSASPPGRNRSGLKDVGSDHAAGSRLILPTRKFTVAPPSGRHGTPSAFAASSPPFTWRSTNGTGGWRRRLSSTTALRYGIRAKSSSWILMSPDEATTASTSARSFCCTWGCFTRLAMVHSSAAAVDSVPAPRNSEMRLTTSPSVTALSPSSWTRRSRSDST
ncbi:hypothetical protein PR202_gb01366 [Eleusine coracana subsp. coracana]|uniref:Uncharacterized protein n=1 Tax=Eleusine coracana subsp. coracana TaxID=191504 RepID=A0AAV5DVP4_ELECO|nr:hypothetical protein PR202_gb01366 [Eleusine coracana subsp. coracana]